MAEESFQLEKILKRQYHADIREKTEQNKQLKLANETLKQQLVCLTSAVQGLSYRVAVFCSCEDIVLGNIDTVAQGQRTGS